MTARSSQPPMHGIWEPLVARTVSRINAREPLDVHCFVIVSLQVGPPATVTATIDGGTTPVTGIRYVRGTTPQLGEVCYGIKWQTDWLITWFLT